jgi:hypothetical protein
MASAASPRALGRSSNSREGQSPILLHGSSCLPCRAGGSGARNRGRYSSEERRRLTPDGPRWLCEEFSDYFHLGRNNPEPDQPMLCDRRCCTSHLEKNIMGMLEPACYVNVCPGTHVHGKRIVSWHLHLIAWGEPREKLGKHIDRLNKRRILLPIANGLAAAHQKRISKGKLASKIGYVLKAPKKAYRLHKWDIVSPDAKPSLNSSSGRTTCGLGNGWPCSG